MKRANHGVEKIYCWFTGPIYFHAFYMYPLVKMQLPRDDTSEIACSNCILKVSTWMPGHLNQFGMPRSLW